ncbi:MAG: hypothetical protein KBD43_14210 [Saprospiraceae bacterium]|nr:hypothetical protein [Saprospiraceae bacterium]
MEAITPATPNAMNANLTNRDREFTVKSASNGAKAATYIAITTDIVSIVILSVH